MRVTFMIPPLSLAGGLRVVADYAKHLAKVGHEVTVIWPKPQAPRLREQLRRLVTGLPQDPDQADRDCARRSYLEPDGPHYRLVECARPFLLPIDLPDADRLVGTWWTALEWMANMPASKGRKVHFVQGDDSLTPGMPMPRLLAAWRQPMHRIAVSPWLVERVQAIAGAVPVSVVLNGVDLARFHAPERGKQETPTVGFVYSPEVMKGAPLMARAIELVRCELPYLRVQAFGAVAPSPTCPLPEGTEYERSPAQPDLARRYAACDVWLWGSHAEGFGLPLLEAMACRTPVVATPAGAAPALLVRGGGRLVHAQDPGDMARAALEILRSPEREWRAISDRALAVAQENCVEKAAETFAATLVDLPD